MSYKAKAILKKAKSKTKKDQVLTTADDYQAAGVDFEDAAGKWRAGDAVKSMRFFQRALEVYEQGLQQFPTNADLAYNKARVQLEIATHPILVVQLQQPVLTVLRAALESHRYALALDQENTDVLFNTAQVLTTIAEEVAKNDTSDDTEAIQSLEEALELQSRCLSLQEIKYEEGTNQQQQDSGNIDHGQGDSEEDTENGGAPIPSSSALEDQWFSIIEPVTRDTLIDTILAQLGSLTTLCGVLVNATVKMPQPTLAWIEEYSTRLLDQKLPLLVSSHPDRLSEISLARANFVSSILEAGYQAGTLDAATYKRERDAAFAVDALQLETFADALLANATSLMSFGSAIKNADMSNVANTRWNTLSAAIASLTAASKIPEITSENLSKTHLLRGDCSLMQRQMGLSLSPYRTAITNASQLIKNAEVFYKNASKISSDQEEKDVALFRSAIAQYLQQGDKSVVVAASSGHGESWAIEQLEDMVLEDLLPAGFQIV